MPRKAMQPLEVEDETHWFTVKRGEYFFLQEQNGQYWFVGLDKKDPWRFSITKEEHSKFIHYSREDTKNETVARLIEIAKLNAHYLKLLTPDITAARLLVYERLLKHQDNTSKFALTVNLSVRGGHTGMYGRNSASENLRSQWVTVRMKLKDAVKYNPGVHSGNVILVNHHERAVPLLNWGTTDFLTGQHTELRWNPIPQSLKIVRAEGWHPDIIPTIQLD